MEFNIHQLPVTSIQWPVTLTGNWQPATALQSYIPSTNHFLLSLSCTKRYNARPIAGCPSPSVCPLSLDWQLATGRWRLFSEETAMSHSSRDQPSCSDQSPEERQGPAVQTISPARSSRSRHRNRTGFASRTVIN